MKEVTHYSAHWDYKNHVGRISVLYSVQLNRNGRVTIRRIKSTIAVQDAAEFTALIDMLRNEKPVFINPGNKEISSGFEPIGEEEYDEEDSN